jgi:hypothetical protein
LRLRQNFLETPETRTRVSVSGGDGLETEDIFRQDLQDLAGFKSKAIYHREHSAAQRKPLQPG